MTCPSCAAPLEANEASGACPWCGAPPAAPPAGQGALPAVATCAGLGCPAGHGPLEVVRLADADGAASPVRSLGRCPECRGLFLGQGVVAALLAAGDRQALAALPATPVAGGACPACAAPMSRRRLGGSSGVIVEVCSRHGLWLEAAELRWLLAPGPLEPLRQALAPLGEP